MNINQLSNNQAAAVAHKAWKDPAYVIALSAAPVCWLLLWLSGAVPRSVGVLAWLPFLQAVVLMPILEEIVFRGGLQTALVSRAALAKRYRGITLANIMTSLIFAAMHLFNQPPLWAALVFFPSLVFGWSRDRYESILPGIILHSLYNAGFIWLFV